MLNLFGERFKNGVAIVSEAGFWDRLGSECTNPEIFEAQGDAHAEIDMRLVDKIESYLVPILGRWENTDSWFHQMDFYGDGIRSLSFSLRSFNKDFVDQLQSFLTGEHEPFCILCQIHEDLGHSNDTYVGSLAIFSEKILISRRVIHLLGVLA